MPKGTEFLLEGVSVERGHVRVLHDIDLKIRAGEAIGFVGPSGAGKTSLMQLLNGSVVASRGHVRVDGRALAELPKRELKEIRANIGFVHQDLALIPNLRVSQNVIAGRLGRMSLLSSLRSFVWPSRIMLAEVHTLLGRVGIPEKLFESVSRLSGGERQRVALARALYQEPGALIADEPVSSIDPTRARDTIALLTRISREEGITLCLSLHNLELAREFLPRLIGLREGRVVFDGSSDALDDARFDSLYRLDDGYDS